MILRMEKLSVFGLLRDKDPILSTLMREQCIQFRPPDDMQDYEEISAVTRDAAASAYEQRQTLSRYTAARANVGMYVTKKGLMARKPRVLYDNLEDGAMLAKAEELCERIERITAEISALRSQKSRDQFSQASLQPWAESSLPLELSSTRECVIAYYLLPSRTDFPELEKEAGQAAATSLLTVVSQDKEQQYLLALCHRDDEEALWTVLRGAGATKVSFAGTTGTALENISELNARIERADKEIEDLQEQLRSAGGDIFPLEYGIDAMTVRVQREQANENIRTTQETFCFTSWVPETKRERAIAILEKFGCYYELTEPLDDEEPPILLKNKPLVKPYESVVSMYSLPAYRGFDPNGFVAVCYFIIFGMMMGDAGIGLLLVIGGLFMDRKMDIGKGMMRDLVRVITMGGVSTIVWGLVFGSFFGDTVQVVARVFLGKTVTFTPLLDPIGQAMVIMGICMGMGLIHMFLGMGIKFYMMVKRGEILWALTDVGCWYAFIIGLLMMLGGAVMGGAMGQVGKWMALVSAVILVLTQGRDTKNPVMRIINGIGSLYDITGYLSDLLSYTRILALGLATGIIAQVFNILGTLMGGGFFGLIFYVIVFVAGTALNLAINTLGSYVHTARLQYVEFFGKFFEGGGKPFLPLMAQTKYIVVTNEEEM